MALKADNLLRAETLGAEPLPSYLSNHFEILFLFHSEDVKRVICPKDLDLPGRIQEIWMDFNFSRFLTLFNGGLRCLRSKQRRSLLMIHLLEFGNPTL